jgi:hypothetical protein
MTGPQQVNALRSDDGFVVSGLVKLALTLGVLAVIGFDLISLLVGSFTGADRASTALRAAVVVCDETRGTDPQKAYDAALAVALDYGDDVEADSFTCSTQQGAVTLTYTHEITTLLMEKIGPLKRFTVSRNEVSGSRN